MVFSREKPGLYRKNRFCHSSLLRLVPPRDNIFCRKIREFGRKLTAGRRGGVIGGTIVLQKLIHCLQCLIVFIEQLQILHRGRGLPRGVPKAGEVGKGSAANEKNQCQSPSECRSKLSAGIEQQPALQPLERARWRPAL